MPRPNRSTRRAAQSPATPPRRASRRVTQSIRTPTPAPEISEEDEEILQPETNEELPSQEEGDPEDGAQDAEEGGDASEEASDQPVVTPRRRPGRPPRTRPLPVGWPPADQDGNDASELGTPGRRGRGRGRGGWRGGPRGRGRRGGAPPITKAPLDDEGNEMDVVDDEVVQPEHSEGEKKVDKDGRLQGGREYRVRTFTIAGRANRLYMLSTEPARCTGFRDSYLFFAKHKMLYKIIVGEDEKKDLIDREVLPHSYKGRTIGVVSARSVYREFGSKIVVGGRKVIDDYNPDEARARGDIEGELADPYDRMPDKGQGYNRNQYVAWHGASSVYHTNAPIGPIAVGSLAGKKRVAITSANWMYEHAREASRFNSSLASARHLVQDGVYDPHTNLMCFPQIMQPTHAVWEQVEEPSQTPPAKKRKIEQVNGHTPALTNGVHDDQDMPDVQEQASPNGLLEPSAFLERNYLIVDTELVTPQHAAWAPPDRRKRAFPPQESVDGEDDYDFDNIADAGLLPHGPPPISDDILATFPADAREAYLRERRLQGDWQHIWTKSAAVRRPKIGIASMTTGG